MKRSLVMLVWLALPAFLLAQDSTLNAASANPAGARPNMLIIMADDCTYNDLALYGGRNASGGQARRATVFSQAVNPIVLNSGGCILVRTSPK